MCAYTSNKNIYFSGFYAASLVRRKSSVHTSALGRHKELYNIVIEKGPNACFFKISNFIHLFILIFYKFEMSLNIVSYALSIGVSVMEL